MQNAEKIDFQVKILVWFRRDLRLHDHAALYYATEQGHEIAGFCSLYENGDDLFEDGSSRWGSLKLKFYLESVLDVAHQFEEQHWPFYYTDKPVMEVLNHLPFDEIWFHRTEGFEEERLVAHLKKVFVCREFETQTLFSCEDLPFELTKIPSVFTEFRKKVEKYSEVKRPLNRPHSVQGIANFPSGLAIQIPDVPIHPQSVYPFSGGERAGLERLKDWIWETHSLRTYKDTRNGLLGLDYSSKLSAYLAWGCISPRMVYSEVKRYESEVVQNSSTYWLIFELLWRDFFLFTARKEQGRFFKMPLKANPKAEAFFDAWKLGKTGQAFVDANMRELLLTGYMSNRGRQNVASYLVHNLKESWVLGARWFEQQLIDYEPCNNYGNWTYVAGVGHDPRENRVFNPVLQAEKYDPDQLYVRLWLKP